MPIVEVTTIIGMRSVSDGLLILKRYIFDLLSNLFAVTR